MDIEKIVNECRTKYRLDFERKLKHELYPAAFADEYSWLRVQAALKAHDEFTRLYVIDAMKKMYDELKN